MVRYISNRKAEIDIHNMHKEEARRHIEQFLSRANGSIKEVSVIHGESLPFWQVRHTVQQDNLVQRQIFVRKRKPAFGLNWKTFKKQHKAATFGCGLVLLSSGKGKRLPVRCYPTKLVTLHGASFRV